MQAHLDWLRSRTIPLKSFSLLDIVIKMRNGMLTEARVSHQPLSVTDSPPGDHVIIPRDHVIIPRDHVIIYRLRCYCEETICFKVKYGTINYLKKLILEIRFRVVFGT